MNWFYAQNGQQAGPVDDAELDRLVRSGTIAESTLVWHSGLANWQPYAAVRLPVGAGGVPSGLPTYGAPVSVGRSFGAAGPGQAQCSQCARVLPADEVVRIDNLDVCAECKPLFMQRRREGALVLGTNAYAGFWIRFAASLLDGIFIIPLYLVFFLVVGLVAGSAGAFQRPDSVADGGASPFFAFAFLLFGLLLWFFSCYCTSRFGGTPGKRICKLRVVTGSGQPVSLGRAMGRVLAKGVSGMILYIGYLFIAFDERKRGLHDIICDTLVVHDSAPLSPTSGLGPLARY